MAHANKMQRKKSIQMSQQREEEYEKMFRRCSEEEREKERERERVSVQLKCSVDHS